jgi:pimeloyl-[acyl-carrier protein] synthase
MTRTSLPPDFETELVSEDFVRDPYPLLRQVRELDPVHWSDAIGGWLLTRYDDILVSFKDTDRFSNENRLGKAVEYLPVERRARFKPFEDHYATKGLLHSDPPDHTRMRGVILKDFTPGVVERMRPSIQAVVDGLLDEAERQGGMDVVSGLAAALPVGVIAEMLGVPPTDRHLFKHWTDMILGFQGVNKPSEECLARAQQGLMELRPYLADMIADRRRNPRADLMSKFAAEAAAGRMSEAELINTCVTLFTAGHETTLSLISNTVLLLLQHPDQLAILRGEPDLLKPMIEEALRYESPVSRQTRLMKQDAELGGKTLRKGEIVFQMLNAANRDPAHFADPDAFAIRRPDNRHIAFGYGPHFCIGATLSRTEGAIAIGTLLRRFPGLRLIDDVPRWDTSKRNSRVLSTLPVALG